MVSREITPANDTSMRRPPEVNSAGLSIASTGGRNNRSATLPSALVEGPYWARCTLGSDPFGCCNLAASSEARVSLRSHPDGAVRGLSTSPGRDLGNLSGGTSQAAA